MKPLRIGVIGAGGRGWLACQAHRPEEDSRVVAACDIEPAALDLARERFGSDIYCTTEVPELLNAGLDAVMICSPDALHEAQACAALEAGLAVYLEKPMAITIGGCDRILETARRTGAKLFVGHNLRYFAVFRKMKALIADGAIGEVRSVWCRHFISYGGDAYFRDWHSERRNTTGMLLQKGAHDLDMIHWLADANPVRVSGFGNLSVYNRCPRRAEDEPGDSTFRPENWPPLAQSGFSPVMDIEDQTVLNLELERGVLGSYLQCHFSPDSCRNYTVIGTEGRIENLGDGPESPIFLWNRRRDTYRMIGDEVHYGEPVRDTTGHGGSDGRIVGEFLRLLRGEITETTATPEAARMAVAAGVCGTQSLRDGGTPLDVPPLP